MNNALKHYGTDGMRWGVRRYQNADGSLTNAGKQRYSSSLGSKTDEELSKTVKRKSLENAYKKATNTSNLDKKKKLADASKSAADSLRELERKIPARRKKSSMDLSRMTDKDMRDAINRKLLEKQYRDVFDAPTVSRGRERLRTIMDVGGATLGVASTSLGIALAIKELRG